MCFAASRRASKYDNNLQSKEKHGQLDSSPWKNMHILVMIYFVEQALHLNRTPLGFKHEQYRIIINKKKVSNFYKAIVDEAEGQIWIIVKYMYRYVQE